MRYVNYKLNNVIADGLFSIIATMWYIKFDGKEDFTP